MTHFKIAFCIFLLTVIYASPATVRAEVKLPSILDSHMVLQQGTPIPMWGWAGPGEEVTVELGQHVIDTIAAADGCWRVTLPAMQAGGPHEITVQGKNTITLTDILVGEVWICSGQSNMEMGLGEVENAEAERAAADYPRIRLFELPQTAAGEPRDDVNAHWRVCHPDNVAEGNWGGFSAAGYFFGRELHRSLDVPVGLIDACWGGTRIAPWTPLCGFEAVPRVAHYASEILEKDREYKTNLPAKLEEIEHWIADTREALAREERLPPSPWWPRHPLESSGEPGGLYNGMIHPLIPFAMRGVIWYQGESNVHERDGMLYFEKMKALVHGWRTVWDQGDFPFYYVQIAPFQYHWHNPELEPHEEPLIWEAQTASLAIPNTGMVVTTDIGDLRDIHPRNKQEVGRRLALWALAGTYGREELVYAGPLFKNKAIEDEKIRLFFDHTGSGLAARGEEPLTWFEIAGEDGRFVKARAVIEKDTVVVWHEDVKSPREVRFGWHQEAQPNLMNAEGLPASPFRTDRFDY
jgi:sialate O-acetylesterase